MKKILKWTGIVLLILIAIFISVNLFMPSEFNVSVSQTIEAPKPLVFNKVADFRTWSKWSSWDKKDPTIKREYGETSRGEGASTSWTSEKSGAGSMRTSLMIEGEKIDNKIKFDNWGDDESTGSWTFESTDNGTKVTWSMQGDVPFYARLMVPAMNSAIKKDFTAGLENLKNLCEQYPDIEVTIKETPAQTIAFVPANTIKDSIGQVLGMSYGLIQAYISTTDAQIAGVPQARYYNAGERMKFDAVLPITSLAKGNEMVKTEEVPVMKVGSVMHIGPYENFEDTYKKFKKWLEVNEDTIIGPSWERYISDPMMEPDSTKWKTEIFFPIK